MILRRILFASIAFATVVPMAARDSVWEVLARHVSEHANGEAAFSWDRAHYSARNDRSALPIGVFDSGIGGLTVLEAPLTADVFQNENLAPGSDGRPDFENERFIYLADQANMPYGNYPAAGKKDFLRELILKDAVFLLGKRYWPDATTDRPRFDKPPVNALVIACNTATAYGLDDLRAAAKEWNIPIVVIGVVEAGSCGLLFSPQEGAVGVLATVGTCASGVYPKTIQRTLGRAVHGIASVTQFGSADLAAVIEGDPALAIPLADQVAADVRGLVEARRKAGAGRDPVPLRKIILGCTHFPLVERDIDAAFADLQEEPVSAPWIAAEREFINPAELTARELMLELVRHRLRARAAAIDRGDDLVFISVPNPRCSDAVITSAGALDQTYGRSPGRMNVEDTFVVPMTRRVLPERSRRLVEGRLPAVWERVPE